MPEVRIQEVRRLMIKYGSLGYWNNDSNLWNTLNLLLVAFNFLPFLPAIKCSKLPDLLCMLAGECGDCCLDIEGATMFISGV